MRMTVCMEVAEGWVKAAEPMVDSLRQAEKVLDLLKSVAGLIHANDGLNRICTDWWAAVARVEVCRRASPVLELLLVERKVAGTGQDARARVGVRRGASKLKVVKTKNSLEMGEFAELWMKAAEPVVDSLGQTEKVMDLLRYQFPRLFYPSQPKIIEFGWANHFSKSRCCGQLRSAGQCATEIIKEAETSIVSSYFLPRKLKYFTVFT